MAEPSIKRKKDLNYQLSGLNYRLMTAVLFWCGLIVMSGMYLTIPLISVFSTSFNISPNDAAWTSTIFCIFFAAGCLVYGPLSDRYGRKKIILIGMVLLTIVSPLVGLFDNIYWIIALRAVQGLVAATFSPVALAYIVEMFPDTKKLTATGFLVTGFLMAGITGQVISGFINQYLSWNYVFSIMGIFYFITIFIVMALPYDDIQRPKSSVIRAIVQMGSLFEIKTLVLTYAVDIMLLMSMMCMYTALGYYLSGPQFGLNSQEILYIRAVGIIGILFASTSGLLAKKFHFFSVLIAGLLIAAVSLILLGMVSNVILLTALSVVFVAGMAVATPNVIELIGQLGGKARGSALSIHTVILFIGAGIGPILATSLLTTGISSLPYLVMGIMLIIGVGLSFLIKRSFNNEPVGN
ncbi:MULTISPECIES: MFS transporter [Methanobacterium]|uniref:MFS transporter n=1 Tax=Methanobacterium veterum TaxID=408577 RepID=A0A9E4ZUN5_9EURY|nr:MULTISPECIES: MFS transporter [Methanobacterium]MCZ3365962.1 MFS transporter [Methanobacterium veterum]MCZ3371427.1 MFS transporter [Methanobacterium veterum]